MSTISQFVDGTLGLSAASANDLTTAQVCLRGRRSKDWPSLSFLVKGHDTTLVKDGGRARKAFGDAHMSPDDLAEDLRQQGVANHAQVKEARLERSGKLSVIKK